MIIRCQVPKILSLVLVLFVPSLLMAQISAPNPTKKPLISNNHSAKEVNPPTYAAEVTKECAVKPHGPDGQAEICMEGAKKYCPKGYAMKQKPHACPTGKMCAAVMEDFCEKMAAK